MKYDLLELRSYDRNALLERIQGGELVEIEGRCAHDEAGLDFLLSVLPAESVSQKENHETIVLSPGSAVFSPDGLLPAVGAGADAAPVWCLPGDFMLFLEAGEDDNSGRVREILVGPFREFDDRNDHEITPGNFLTDPEWDFVVGCARREAWQLQQLIGELPEGAHPDEIKPRAASFMAERANWETEASELRAEASELRAEASELRAEASELRAAVSELSARNAELLTASVTPVSDVVVPVSDVVTPEVEDTSPAVDVPKPPKDKGSK